MDATKPLAVHEKGMLLVFVMDAGDSIIWDMVQM